MTWDPEVDDLSEARRRTDEPGPSDVGPDRSRDFGDEPPPAWRTEAPDLLAPIDPNAPVSGHVTPPAARSMLDSPEHDWHHAESLLYPSFRPVGTHGVPLDGLDVQALAATTGRGHVAPLVDQGPVGLAIVYAIRGGGFDVIVNGEHVLSWGVEPAAIREAAMRNLAAWAVGAAWTDEASGDRRLLSSDTGEGCDAVRILLPETRDHLVRELGQSGRVLVGLPERHLLVAGSLRPGDEEFADLFGGFVVEQSGGADEPIDRRVFELVDGELVEFAA